MSKLVRTGTSVSPVYERTIYIDGVFEYVKQENPSSTYQKNYVRIMDNKSQVAEVRIGNVFPGDISDSITYIIEDQIGSSVARLSTSGNLIDREEYYPFGDSSLRTFTYKRYRYVGKEKDTESGLYYYGARYYAAWTCRFISVDPLAAQYVHLTPYNYAGNKPIGDYDIDGMQGSGETPSMPAATTNAGSVPANMPAGRGATTGGNGTNATGGSGGASKPSASKGPSTPINDGSKVNITVQQPTVYLPQKPATPAATPEPELRAAPSGGTTPAPSSTPPSQPYNEGPRAEISQDHRSAYDKEQSQIYGEARNWSTPRGWAINLLNIFNPIKDVLDIHSYVKNNSDSRGWHMEERDAVFKGIGLATLFIPIKFGEAAKEVLNPNEIHFMQSSIKNTTGEFTVLDNAKALKSGALDPEILRMNVWKDPSGKIWTLDHRRLAAFRLSGLKEAPIQWANPTNHMWKMTTANGGVSIRLKLGGGQSIIVR